MAYLDDDDYVLIVVRSKITLNKLQSAMKWSSSILYSSFEIEYIVTCITFNEK
jgi:hypothetical protein